MLCYDLLNVFSYRDSILAMSAFSLLRSVILFLDRRRKPGPSSVEKCDFGKWRIRHFMKIKREAVESVRWSPTDKPRSNQTNNWNERAGLLTNNSTTQFFILLGYGYLIFNCSSSSDKRRGRVHHDQQTLLPYECQHHDSRAIQSSGTWSSSVSELFLRLDL